MPRAATSTRPWAELQAHGALGRENRSIPVLAPRSEMTGADRAWAASYQPGDVLHYSRGSKEHGIERGSYATVVAINPEKQSPDRCRSDGEQVTYDPSACMASPPTASSSASSPWATGSSSRPRIGLDVQNRDRGHGRRSHGRCSPSTWMTKGLSHFRTTRCATSTTAMP